MCEILGLRSRIRLLIQDDGLPWVIFVLYLLYALYCSAEDVLAEAPTTSNPELGEPMDILTGLQLVLKKALAHDGLARGLHEGAKAIEKHAAQLCVLAEDCNQPDYTKLVQALCSEHNVNLISVPSAKKLGEWAGVSSLPVLIVGFDS